MLIKNKVMKNLTKTSWKKLGTAPRGKIAEDVARQILRSSYSENDKVSLLAKLPTIGWSLKTLSTEGYGYNKSSEAHYDRDNAGKLNQNNKNSEWVYTKVA
tara:strand:+ start:421 stop:723 length:303 start_codon:yes stop_codon:yes gene_type:complete